MRLKSRFARPPDPLPPELRRLVKQSVAILGEVIRQRMGARGFAKVERIRERMASLRNSSSRETSQVLDRTLRKMRELSEKERFEIAHAFSLMLELMNTCENAYRAYRLRQRPRDYPFQAPEQLIFVLTAHPTEARSPDNIAVFHEIQNTLTRALAAPFPGISAGARENLKHSLQIAWQVHAARQRKPRVEDEAEHIDSILFREDTLATLLDANRKIAPIQVRSWVGGDKDGHPGVNQLTMIRSLGLSRTPLLAFVRAWLAEVHRTLSRVPSREIGRVLHRAEKRLAPLRTLRAADGDRVLAFRNELARLIRVYTRGIGATHPSLERILDLLRVFPALVLPLELRESSDVIMRGGPLVIARMLRQAAALAGRGDSGWYAAGFIISMTSSDTHIRAALELVKENTGKSRIPVVPLFEQRDALARAPEIISRLLADPALKKLVRRQWNNSMEIMLGYSDSAKEIGVLPSRFAIREALLKLNSVFRAHGIRPVIFHGQGGSIDRGGGSITEQIAWWPREALRVYKVTIQGEMVERSFASPEIILGPLERIVKRFETLGKKTTSRPASPESREAAGRFVRKTMETYETQIASPSFMNLVQEATAYRFLSSLKLGSRPAARTMAPSISGLRAIPWVLCWTQTRILFPTWWGIGTAWNSASHSEKRLLKEVFANDPLLSSFVKALGFTLAKVELPIWRMYLINSRLTPKEAQAAFFEFQREYLQAVAFVRAISGKNDLVWFRPWLSKSIQLRSPMVHPLNLLQIIAIEEQNPALLRETATGIASGMMTTG